MEGGSTMWMQLCKGEHNRWDRDGRTVGGAGANELSEGKLRYVSGWVVLLKR